jgi:predicted mannosyl-3-phosphoglycerate phosphatase (HAD superfamily)
MRKPTLNGSISGFSTEMVVDFFAGLARSYYPLTASNEASYVLVSFDVYECRQLATNKVKNQGLRTLDLGSWHLRS